MMRLLLWLLLPAWLLAKQLPLPELISSQAVPLERLGAYFGLSEVLRDAGQATVDARKLPTGNVDRKSLEELKELLLSSLSRAFQPEEVAQALKFLDSPAGKKILYARESISGDLQRLAKDWVERIRKSSRQNKVFQEFSETLPALRDP
jgi:hypothetical protein